MNPGHTFVKDGKTFYVREIDGDEAVVIEDGVGEPDNLNYEPGPDVLQRMKIADISPPASTWTSSSTPVLKEEPYADVGAPADHTAA